MPIDREDGRHWCAPDQETPDEDGVWVCTGCGLSWTRVLGNLWMRTDDVPAYLTGEQERVGLASDLVTKPDETVPVVKAKKGKV